MITESIPGQQGAKPAEVPAHLSQPDDKRTLPQRKASGPGTSGPDIPAIAATLERVLGDRYEVLQPISIGGMATIFQLRHRLHGGFFVAKVLHRNLVATPGVLAAFQREAGHVARLAGHPGIVPVFDVLEMEGTWAMLLPYVEGEDLDAILRQRGKFTRDEALMLLAQLSSLLMYAEGLGIVHCDVAPGNIRLDHFGNYRLLDFGLSRSPETERGDAIPSAGTPTYNSPEQIRGEVPDIRTDLYSLGLVLAEVLIGEPLLQAPTLEDLAARHLAADRTLPPGLEADPPIARLLRSLIAADRNQRMGSAFELSGAIAAMGFELPSFSRALNPAGSAGVHLPRPRRRRLEST